MATWKKLLHEDSPVGDFPDLSGTYSVKAGNTGLTTVGTIGTGTWNGTAIATAYIANNAVTLAKMAGIDRGHIIYGDSSGDPASLANSTTDGHVLTVQNSSGDIGWEAIPAQSSSFVNTADNHLDMNGYNLNFDDNTGIRDDSSNEQLWFQKTASAVNYVEITNSAAGNSPAIGGAGETNTGLRLNVSGSGVLALPNSWSIGGTGVSSTAAELNILDGVTADKDELNLMDGCTATTAELNIMDGVTATAAELNIMDGVTATATELNLIDGVTATTAELNLLDGVTATTAELNIMDGVTSTAAELNLLDGTVSAAELAFLDGATAGTAVASKAVVVDANLDVGTIRNLAITGNLSVTGVSTVTNTSMETIDVEDPQIRLNAQGTADVDCLIIADRGSGNAKTEGVVTTNGLDAAFFYDSSTGHFAVAEVAIDFNQGDTSPDAVSANIFPIALATASSASNNADQSPIGSIHVDTDDGKPYFRQS